MTDHQHGLTQAEAARLLAEYGPNSLPEPKRMGVLRRFVRQLKSPMIAVLLFAVFFDVTVWFLDALRGWPVEGTMITAVLLLNAGLGAYQKFRSEAAAELFSGTLLVRGKAFTRVTKTGAASAMGRIAAMLAGAVAVFAPVTPAHKLRLVEAFRVDGHIVAMTGDGVNDAPALKRADVGVAMGKRGSDVAREVADLVLLDDNFATIVSAIEEGRGIYENIQSFIRFTFSTNIALVVLVVTGAVAAYLEGLRDAAGMLIVPLTAVQLLWINFLGDGPPALALAVDRTPGHMERPPRAPVSPLLDRSSATFILGTGAIKGVLAITLLVVMPKLGYGAIAIQGMLVVAVAVLATWLTASAVRGLDSTSRGAGGRRDRVTGLRNAGATR